ncbi:MAG TPA: hypothetical protein VMZ27_05035 [Candidatus Saccharimonadales bacterium]|nr:hypothetical protein [Candidatus Saccharimonadales bacterium]
MTATGTPVRHDLVRRTDLTARQRLEMFCLLRDHFEGTAEDQFERDLNEKNWVILLTRNERLLGFSTLLVYEASFEDAAVSVVCSGDTIVAQEAWGTMALARAWIESVNHLRRLFPNGRYYWLLLTSGFRTYRFLPVFWRTFYPRVDARTPDAEQRLLTQLASDRYGIQYDVTSGIVRFNQPQPLRDDLKHIPPGRTGDPHIAFFAARNPGHDLGDELVCLTELTPDNLTAAGRRMVSPKTYALQSCHC